MGSVAMSDGSACVPKCPKHARAHKTAESMLWSLGWTFDWQAGEWVRVTKKNPSQGGHDAAGDDREATTQRPPQSSPPPSKATANWRDPRRVYDDDSDDHEDCATDTRDKRDNEFDELG